VSIPDTADATPTLEWSAVHSAPIRNEPESGIEPSRTWRPIDPPTLRQDHSIVEDSALGVQVVTSFDSFWTVECSSALAPFMTKISTTAQKAFELTLRSAP